MFRSLYTRRGRQESRVGKAGLVTERHAVPLRKALLQTKKWFMKKMKSLEKVAPKGPDEVMTTR